MTDTMTEAGAAAAAGNGSSAASEARGRSTIAFPYDDLAAATEVVRVAHEVYGGKCTPEDVAARLDQQAGSGAFRNKVGAARVFGLIGAKRGEVKVTDLGRRVLDRRTSADAKAEAFLTVPLYAALFEEYRTGPLPSDLGLEAKIKNLGVPVKSARSARQVFQRSAQQAGFFQAGTDRLVRPAVNSIGVEPVDDDDDGDRNFGKDPDIGMKPAIIAELFRRLPDDGQPFPDEDRTLWMDAFVANLNLVYGRAPKKQSRVTEEDFDRLNVDG